MKKNKETIKERPPVIAIMGHIDHGKSTLLDYIRKTNIVEKEAGGITQAISAYEVLHKNEKGEEKKITFLDTPGHAAFQGMRERGAKVADIAILIVSAEDGVMPQTKEAWKAAKEKGIPVIVAINKIDKPGSNIEKCKSSLIENEIYLENNGGDVPFVPISATRGDGVDELLSMIQLLADIEGFKGDQSKQGTGYIIEANRDTKTGIQATLIIKDGTISQGMNLATENSTCPVRIMKDFKGKTIKEASFSSPVLLSGWSEVPLVGSKFETFKNKADAIKYTEEMTKLLKEEEGRKQKEEKESKGKKAIPLVIKADVSGSIEAIEKEIKKIKCETAYFKTVSKGEGIITESDIKSLVEGSGAIVLGFNVKASPSVNEFAERRGVEIATFDIIYKMTEWLEEELDKRRPRVETEEVIGTAKILKVFSKTKEKQVVGGLVSNGKLTLGKAKILRKGNEIGKGRITNLEKNKNKSSEVMEGSEFGMMIEAKTEIAEGDEIESFNLVKK